MIAENPKVRPSSPAGDIIVAKDVGGGNCRPAARAVHVYFFAAADASTSQGGSTYTYDSATGDVRSFVPKGLRALPRSLGEAAERLAACAAARDIFGSTFIDHFVMTRTHEDDVLRRAVSAAERARYLEAI